MISSFRTLMGIWSTSESNTKPATPASAPKPPPARQRSTAQTAPSAAKATRAPKGSVNYPTLPDLDTDSTAAPASSGTVRIQQYPYLPFIDNDVSAMKAPPPPSPAMTPPHERDTPLSFTKDTRPPTMRHATVEDHHTDEARNTTIAPASGKGSDRPKLEPKRQQHCRRKPAAPKPKRDFVSEIVYEVASEDNPLPEGYLGTFRGTRWYSPDYNACLECGLAGEHRLVCGHWIKSDGPCGMSCNPEKLDHAPFICPTCRDIVQDVLKNKLTDVEIAKLNGLKGKDDVFLIGCCVEYVAKRAPELEANITEMVFNILRVNYGRACEASTGPPPVDTPPFEQTIRELQENQERKEREKLAKEHPLNKHEKRKDINDADGSAQYWAQTSNTLPQNNNAEGAQDTSTSLDTNKKLKEKLETHREPITPQTRGSKRTSNYEAVNEAITPTNDTNKKLKKKLETHREPITSQTRGTKRPLRTTSAYSNPSHPAKRITLTTPPDLGEALFMDSQLGSLIRNGDSAVYTKTSRAASTDTYSRKRRRSALKLDARDEEIQFDVSMPHDIGGMGLAS